MIKNNGRSVSPGLNIIPPNMPVQYPITAAAAAATAAHYSNQPTNLGTAFDLLSEE